MGFDVFMLQEPTDLGSDYTPQFDDQPEYWRFVSVGMRGMAELMLKAGVLESDTPSPEWPWPPDGFSEERLAQIEEWVFLDDEPQVEPTDDEKRVLAPIRDQIARLRATRSNEPGKVPAFKFLTNDGWMVTPDECRLIAAGLTTAVGRATKFFGLFSSFLPSKKVTGISKREAAEWILNWAAFNDVASRYGGYKVL